MVLCLSVSCSQSPLRVQAPPPPNDPNVGAANHAFIKGDWNTLRGLLKRLPGEGAYLDDSLFYQALILGLDDPKKAVDKMQHLQGSSNSLIKERANFYHLIFKAKSGDCLLTVGPLRKLYWPKINKLPVGSQSHLKTALKYCDKEELVIPKFETPKREKIVSNTEQSKQTQVTASQALDNPDQLSVKSSVSQPTSHLKIALTKEQRRSVSPYLQLWLPLTENSEGSVSSKPAGINDLLSESSPLLIDERESQGERLEIERLDIGLQGQTSVSNRYAELRSEVDALIAVTPTKELHDAVMSVAHAQNRPLFILTPYPIKTDGDTNNLSPIWRIYPDTKLIAEHLVKLAAEQDSQGVGLIIPDGPNQAAEITLFQELLKKRQIKLIRHQSVKADSDWSAVANKVRDWPVDTIIFASLPTLSVTSLVTNLAAKGIWSADHQKFEEVIKLKGSTPKEDLFRRFLLWPSIYNQQALDQAGRYLEGARTVTPVMRESFSFISLDQKLFKEVGRRADLLDAIMLDLLSIVDHAVRKAEVKQIEVDQVLTGDDLPLQYLRSLDFKSTEPLKELFTIEVYQQKFRRLEQQETTSKDSLKGPSKEPIKKDSQNKMLEPKATTNPLASDQKDGDNEQ